jgi:hypothetical protein
MSDIGPRQAFSGLEDGARLTREGKGAAELLSGVITDALQKSPEKDFLDNRKLAELIGHAMLTLKGSHGGKPKFVIGWRLYPNAENREYWDPRTGDHRCSCGCGCTCVIGPKNGGP